MRLIPFPIPFADGGDILMEEIPSRFSEEKFRYCRIICSKNQRA